MKHLKPGEVARRVDQRQISQELLSPTMPKPNIFIGTHDPLATRFMQVNRRIVECVTPVDHRGVVMGMRDGDGGKAAKRFHALGW